MKCQNCGAENVRNARFCEFCGKPIIPADLTQLLPPINEDEQINLDHGTSHDSGIPPVGFIHDPEAFINSEKQGARRSVQQAQQQKAALAPRNTPPGVDHIHLQDQKGPAASSQSKSVSPATVAPVKKSSAKKALLIILPILLIMLAAGIGAFFYFQPKKDFIDSNTLIEENIQYLVALPTDTVDSSGQKTGFLSVGEVVRIYESGLDENGNEWGRLESGDWVEMSDGSNQFLIAANEESSQTGENDGIFSEDSSNSNEGAGSTQSNEGAGITQSNEEVENSQLNLSKQKQISFTPSNREVHNYSGPAVAQMIIGKYSGSVSQSVLAEELGLIATGVADFQSLENVLQNRTPLSYTAVLYDPYEVTSAIQSQFLQRIINSLDQDKLVIAVMDGEPFLNQSDSIYALIYGYEEYTDGSKVFKIYLPDSQGTYLELTDQELLKNMEQANYFCYLY